MIPKILHQIFFKPTHIKMQSIPWQWKSFSTKSRKKLKQWQYFYWDYTKASAWLRKHYPELLYLFDNKQYSVVVQTDILRYLLLQHFGGWYIDFDYEITRSLDPWNKHSIVLPLEREPRELYQPGNIRMIGNTVLASKAGHPFWKLLIQRIQAFPKEDHNNIQAFTGPEMLSREFHKLPEEEKKNYTIPERQYFHSPVTYPVTYKNYASMRAHPEIYGIHYCHGMWKDASFRKTSFKRILTKNYLGYFFIRIYRKIRCLLRI